MTSGTNGTIPVELLNQNSDRRLDALPELFRAAINTAKQIERPDS